MLNLYDDDVCLSDDDNNNIETIITSFQRAELSAREQDYVCCFYVLVTIRLPYFKLQLEMLIARSPTFTL